MFESVELGRALSKKQYERESPELRARMVQAELSLKEARLPVIIIIAGVDGAGKGELVHRLNEWFDPRGLDTHAFWHESEEEREHPFYWHFWQALPARGRMALLLGAWYTQPVVQRVYGKINNAELDAALQRIAFFEQTLAHDNTLIIKLWLHLSARSLNQRLKDLDKNRNTHWRVLPSDWAHQKRYGKFMKVCERAVRETDLEKAPWHIIEATEPRYRDMTAARIIVEAIEKRLAQCSRNKFIQHGPPPKLKVTESGEKTILDKIDLTLSVPRDRYEHKLAKYQARLNKLLWAAHEKKIANVIVFEGWDASGKGSCIRRVTAAMDPRLFRVVPIAAPSDEERARHYLWRFWRQLPADGIVTIFDRSWYGRVLVERVEGFASANEWMHAYREINVFEEHLDEHGTVITKFWIHISKEEQLRRFRERESVSFKRHKITREDWRNRGKWDDYKAAINDMVAHTSTEFAPWVLVAGEDKKYARIQILKALCEKLERVV